MPDSAERTVVRPGRCAHHHGVASAGTCDICGIELCLPCSVPVRGSRVGPECLGIVLENAPPAEPGPPPSLPRGERLAAAGFGLVVALSVFPWSRFGADSGVLRAWTLHWSLAAVAAGAAGLVAAVVARRGTADPRLESAWYLVLAAVVAAASLLHWTRPPPLSSPAPTPLLAVACAAVAAAGGAAKLLAILRLRRWGARPGD